MRCFIDRNGFANHVAIRHTTIAIQRNRANGRMFFRKPEVLDTLGTLFGAIRKLTANGRMDNEGSKFITVGRRARGGRIVFA